jgi:hypothetical protein
VTYRFLSDGQFEMLAVLAVVGIAIGWGARDVLLLRRHWARRAAHRDQIFGSILGLVMIGLGVAGMALHLAGR